MDEPEILQAVTEAAEALDLLLPDGSAVFISVQVPTGKAMGELVEYTIKYCTNVKKTEFNRWMMEMAKKVIQLENERN